MRQGFQIKFRNGVNGTLVDWTNDVRVHNMSSIKRRVESRRKGEAGLIGFDGLGLTLRYVPGSPIYNAFNIDYTNQLRYIFEIHGVKSDNTTVKCFEGVCDFSSIDFPDMERKISFEVIDKLKALDILTNTNKQRTSFYPVGTRVDSATDYIYGFSGKGSNGQITDHNWDQFGYYDDVWCFVSFDNNESYWGAPLNMGQTIFKQGETIEVPYGDSTKKYFVMSSWLDAVPATVANQIGSYATATWCRLYPVEDSAVSLAFGKDENTIYTNQYYDKPAGHIDVYDSSDYYNQNPIKGFDALKLMEVQIKNAWPNDTIINQSGDSIYPMSLDYFTLLIDEMPLGKHPYEMVKMCADSMRCYVFYDKLGRFVIKAKSSLGGGTKRVFNTFPKNRGTRKPFWEKIADGVTIIVKSGTTVNGVTLQGSASIQRYAGIKPRNEVKLEIIAPYTVEATQESLDVYAETVANEVFNFYGKRRWAYPIGTALYDEMLDWEMLDTIEINGVDYFLENLELDLFKWFASFNPVGVTGYNYNRETVHLALDSSKFNAGSSPGTSTSQTIAQQNLSGQAPLVITDNIIQLNYTDNFKLSVDNKLETIQDIKKTSTTIEFARMAVGGAPDSTYKFKNYGDEWIVGNQKIDGVQSIGGAADVNFKQKIYGHQKVTGNITVDGDIYIGGSINRVNVVDLDISDHAIRLNKGGDNSTALDGGIEMLGAGDVLLGSIKYSGANWISDLNIDIASGKTYKINNVDVLSSTTLGASVLTSSLTTIGTLNHDLNIANTKVYKINGTEVLSNTTLGSSVLASSLITVGTLTTGIWNATPINGQYLNYNTTNLKVTTNKINTIQDIATTSSPAFTNITLTGIIDQQGTSNSEFGSQSLLPKQNHYGNLGGINKKWLTLHAAELWVETLVAQETIGTIGGRVLVGPTTVLVADLSSGSTTITVKHNQMVNGDIVYMEAEGKVEFMRINSSYSGSAGNYTYSVARNLDGSGANTWYAGDAMFNTGQAGSGFIDLYSVRGIKTASQTGPTIVGNARNSSTYNDWSEHWAIGNLNGLYGYSTNTFGVGLGKYASNSTNITIDSTNGYRIRLFNDVIAQWDNTGKITLGKIAASTSRLELASGAINFIYRNGSNVDTTKMSLDASGNGSFTGTITATAGSFGGWSITSPSIYKLSDTGNNRVQINLYGELTNYCVGLQVTAQTISPDATKLISTVGSYNDGFAPRYGISVWDAVNNAWLLNVGYGGASSNTVATISGWSFDITKLYNSKVRIEASSSLKGLSLNDGSYDIIKIGEFATATPPDVYTDYSSSMLPEGDFSVSNYSAWSKTNSSYCTNTNDGTVGYCLTSNAQLNVSNFEHSVYITKSSMSGYAGKTLEVQFSMRHGTEYSSIYQTLVFTVESYNGSSWSNIYSEYFATSNQYWWQTQTFRLSIPSNCQQLRYTLRFFVTGSNKTFPHLRIDEIKTRIYDKTFFWVNETSWKLYNSPGNFLDFSSGVFRINASEVLIQNKKPLRWLGSYPTGYNANYLAAYEGDMYEIGSTVYLVTGTAHRQLN
ncbi:hypothetical protein C4588_07545 [Candidatus Parcubacteria bacterium]|nr:MAG: hypothetical protein C4588_07545 [Candidatus Parcubacteria bacterium]